MIAQPTKIRAAEQRALSLVSSFKFLVSRQCHTVAPENMKFAKRTHLALPLYERHTHWTTQSPKRSANGGLRVPTFRRFDVYFRFSAFSPFRSSTTNTPSLRIIVPSNQISPPPRAASWRQTMSQWTPLRLVLSASSYA